MSWGRQWLQINTVYKKLKVSKYRLFEMMWIQCLITVLRQFFKSICTTNHSDGKKPKTFAVLWLQIIRNQWTNMCYVNIFDMSCFLMTVMLFEFHHILFFHVKKPLSCIPQQTTAHRSPCWPDNFNTPSGVYKPILLFLPLLTSSTSNNMLNYENVNYWWFK